MAVPEQQAPTVQQGRDVSNRLVATFRSINAVVLCGSVARGDADSHSDLDLVVIGSTARLTTQRLLKHVTDIQQRVSIMYYTMREFKQLLHDGILFTIHVREEGIILFDRIGIEGVLANSSISPAAIDKQIKMQAAKLGMYRDSQRFHNNFLFCLSHLYTIGKAVVMLDLAKRGQLEFNRDAAFEHFAGINPELAPETQTIARLRPFYTLVNARQLEELPFSYKSAGREMHEVVRAIQRLADVAQRS